MMSELHRPFADEQCPIADKTLGEMYRASAHELRELIATVPSAARALLAMYCFRRAHLEIYRSSDCSNLRKRRPHRHGR